MDISLDRKLQGFQLIAQEKLQAVICSIPGRKNLILEAKLIKPMEHICSASWLKLKGIQRIHKFEPQFPSERQADSVHVYIISNECDTFTQVLAQIHRLEIALPMDKNAATKNFHIICVPSCLSYFHTILEDEALYGLVQLHSYSWDFLYLDNGVLTMGLSKGFSDLFIHEDTSLLPCIARSLRILHLIAGRPDLIISYGEHSANIIKMLSSLDVTAGSAASSKDNPSDIAVMLVIDRDKDYASSLLTPAIYAGLLLEVFHSYIGEIDLGSNKILDQMLKIFMLHENTAEKYRHTGSTSKNIICLSSLSDEIYGENCYKHFSKASSIVRMQAKAMGMEMKKIGDMKLQEMNDYVARKLPKITALKSKIMRHLNAIEKVIEMLATNFQHVQSLEEDILNNNTSRRKLLQEIDNSLTTDPQRYNILRLLCLLHLSIELTSDELLPFVRNYCNTFGYQHLPIFNKLAKAKLLPTLEKPKVTKKSAKILSNIPIPKFQQTQFQANSNRLKLLKPTSPSKSETDSITSLSFETTQKGSSSMMEEKNFDPSYVFNGLYIPLVAQLCSLLLRANTADEVASKLDMIDNLWIHKPDSIKTIYDVKSFASATNKTEVKNVFPLHKRNIFVFVVGGITYSEIASCKLVGQLTGSEIIIASNDIISGTDMISGAFC